MNSEQRKMNGENGREITNESQRFVQKINIYQRIGSAVFLFSTFNLVQWILCC